MGDEPVVELGAVIRARRWWMVLAAAIAFGGAGLVRNTGLFLGASGLGMMCVFLALVERRTKATLRARGGSLYVGNKKSIPAPDMREGYIVPGDPESNRKAQVVVRGRHHCIVAELAFDSAEAGELLKALAVDATQRTATFKGVVLSPVIVGLVIAVTLILLAGGLLGGAWAREGLWPFVGTTVFVLAIAAWLERGYPIKVGQDGVLVSKPSGKRFYAHRDIERVKREGRVVTLHLKNATVVELDCTAPFALVMRIERARLHSAPTAAQDALASTADVSDDAWIASLRELGTGAAYRGKELDVESLYATLGSGFETAERRAAAAFVLRLRVPEEATPHIRVAAEAAADPALREALTHLVEPTADPDQALKRLRQY